MSSSLARPTAPPAPRVEPDAPRPTLDVTVLVPVTERPAPLVELYRAYAAPLRASGRSFEFLFAASPARRDAVAPLAELAAAGEPVRVAPAERNVGETALVREGLRESRGRIVVTLPAYYRVAPEAIPALVDAVERGTDVAVARRWPRRDPAINRLQNRVLNAVVGRLTGAAVHDVGSGVHALRREAFEDIPLHGDFVRFLPVLALQRGYAVQEVDAAQHPGDLGTRVYAPGVYIRRVLDLLGLYFLLRFLDKPLRFFGLVGFFLSLVGAGTLFVLLVRKASGETIGDKPLLLLGILLLTLGVQAVALGLIGEMIVHFSAAGRRIYRVRAAPATPAPPGAPPPSR